MDTKTRILELALKWQNRALWKVAADAERGAVEKRTEADRHFGSSQYMAERGHDASLWVKNAEQADRWAELRLKHVESCMNELCELANLVRAHRPELLEFVPEIDLNQEPTGAIRDLKRLESGLRKPAAAETPTANRPRRTKPPMPQRKVEEHWLTVMNSGNRDLVQEYLTLAETKLAKKIGCSRNTLRSVEAFQQRDTALREFNRQNR